jgi:hypothetical protein
MFLLVLATVVVSALHASERVPFNSATTTRFTIEQAPGHQTLLIAVHNASDTTVTVRIAVLREDGAGVVSQAKNVKARATWTVNLHDWALPYTSGVFNGSANISADKEVLIGDEISVDPSQAFSHANQLIPVGGSCAPTCTRHIVRYLSGGAFDGGTVFTVSRGFTFTNEFQATLYDEQGGTEGPQFVSGKPTNFALDIDELAPVSPFGVAYFDFGTASAQVMATYRSGGKYSVQVESWCDDCNPCNAQGGCYNPDNPRCVPPPPQLCGNGRVDPGEDCHTCPADAGVCPVCVPATITLAGATTCTVGQPCSNTATATGTGLGPILNSTLPVGMSRIANTASGTPLTATSYDWSVVGQCGTGTAHVTVNAAPPTCEQSHPPSWGTIATHDDGTNLSGTVGVHNAGVWKLYEYATSTEGKCTAGTYDYEKATDISTLTCGHDDTLSTAYRWLGHGSEWWWFTLKKDGVIVARSACLRNTHN